MEIRVKHSSYLHSIRSLVGYVFYDTKYNEGTSQGFNVTDTVKVVDS
jgi:hypothetical protein